MSDLPAWPSAKLPERLDRSLRLGPFPSASAAMRFAGYTAVGGLAAGLLGPWAWLPFLGLGLLVTTQRPHGRNLEGVVWEYAEYVHRRGRIGSRRGRPPSSGQPLGSLIRLPSGYLLAAVRATGIPVAFLPPEDARRLYHDFRKVLKGLSPGFIVQAESQSLSARGFLPSQIPLPAVPESSAREGYREMVWLLCRRRRQRTVTLFLWSPRHGAALELDRRVGAAQESLSSLGVLTERLRGRALAEATQGMLEVRR